MGKNKKYSQSKICDYLCTDFFNDTEIIDTAKLSSQINMLAQNGKAYKISGTSDLLCEKAPAYFIASKFICKYNKDLLKFLAVKRQSKMIDEMINKAGMNSKIVELQNEGLLDGFYMAYIPTDNNATYIILSIESDPHDDTWVKYNLYFLGKKKEKFKNKYFKMVSEYQKLTEKEKEDKVIYADESKPVKTIKFKSFDKMVFKNKEKIIDYIDNWVNCIPEYHKYEMIPKLSILLYGEPGTGKSTFYKALAKYLDIDTIKIINKNYFINGTKNMRPSRNNNQAFINVLDDIDCFSKSREDDTSNDNGTILSNLLEFLDNPDTFYYKAKDGLFYPVSIVVATTNYYDRLDEAVKRYGRFDLKIKMDPFDRKYAEKFCSLYNLNLDDIYKGKVSKEERISPAYLQALCLENIDLSLKSVKEENNNGQEKDC